MPETMLTLERDGEVAILQFRPDSTAGPLNVEQTAKELYSAIEGGQSKRFVLDFADISALSSQALGVMLTARLKAAKSGATLVLANVRERFAQVLSLTNLDKLFTIFPSREAAVRSLAS